MVVVNKEEKIVNGGGLSDDDKDNISWFASLMLNGSLYCGGTYIGNSTILTAAHCIKAYTPTRVRMGYFGPNDPKNKTTLYEVESVKIHPKYNEKTTNNDIAYVILKTDPSSDGFKPLAYYNRIGKNNSLTDVGTPCTVLGYGTTSSGGSISSILLKTDIFIMDVNNSNYDKNEITSGMILAGDENDPNDPNDNEDSCQGDSGGPLIAWDDFKKQWVLIGIVSWGYGCAMDGYPGVYTNVMKYVKWIRNKRRVRPNGNKLKKKPNKKPNKKQIS